MMYIRTGISAVSLYYVLLDRHVIPNTEFIKPDLFLRLMMMIYRL